MSSVCQQERHLGVRFWAACQLLSWPPPGCQAWLAPSPCRQWMGNTQYQQVRLRHWDWSTSSPLNAVAEHFPLAWPYLPSLVLSVLATSHTRRWVQKDYRRAHGIHGRLLHGINHEQSEGGCILWIGELCQNKGSKWGSKPGSFEDSPPDQTLSRGQRRDVLRWHHHFQRWFEMVQAGAMS